MTRKVWFVTLVLLLYTRSQAFLPHIRSKVALASASSNVGDIGNDFIGHPPGTLPAASSKTNFAPHKVDVKYDVWIVGAGTLGELIVKGMQPLNSQKIIAETKCTERQSAITNLGAEHRVRTDRANTEEGSARSVVICLPPSCAVDYTAEIHAATRLWAGPEGGGNLIFTSSIAVYGESPGNIVDELFRVDTRSASSTK